MLDQDEETVTVDFDRRRTAVSLDRVKPAYTDALTCSVPLPPTSRPLLESYRKPMSQPDTFPGDVLWLLTVHGGRPVAAQAAVTTMRDIRNQARALRNKLFCSNHYRARLSLLGYQRESKENILHRSARKRRFLGKPLRYIICLTVHLRALSPSPANSKSINKKEKKDEAVTTA